MLQTELETAIHLARKAGQSILDHYKTDFATEQKIGTDEFSEPVTVADRDASRIIVDGLKTAFPTDAVLSEEEPDELALRLSRSRVWIVDPLDGTKGFVNKDGDFAVQIGLAVDGVPVLGVVYMPLHDLMNHAVKGAGAFLIRDGGKPVRLQTSDKTDLPQLILAMSRDHPSKRMERIIEHFGWTEVVKRGSVGLKVSLIAERSADVYIHPSPRTKLWDTCAPQIILEEAGGRFTDLFGSEMRYDRADLQNRNGIVATSGVSHEGVIEKLKPLLVEFGRVPVIQ